MIILMAERKEKAKMSTPHFYLNRFDKFEKRAQKFITYHIRYAYAYIPDVRALIFIFSEYINSVCC